jgi:hypothetical protein
MGHQANCGITFGKRRAKGKALLETSELVFHAADGTFRLKIAFSSITAAKAVDGELRLQTADGLAAFELGAAAEKWREKILHPKTRLEKLGVKTDASVSLVGDFAAEFLAELRSCTKNVVKDKVVKDQVPASSEWVFFAVPSSKELAQVPKLASRLQGSAALWIVYPKGQKTITENEVLAAGRKAGLKDVKVVGFSPTHTALKFVIPRDRR